MLPPLTLSKRLSRDHPPLGFAVAGLEHAHVHTQCQGLLAAGARLKWVHDPDPAKVARFCAEFPAARVARELDELLADPEVRLVASAAVPCDRGALGCRIMQAGKDFFTDKAPFTTLAQLAETRRTVAATGRKCLVYFSERLHHGAVRRATELIASGALGRVVHVAAFGPHRLGATGRPAWFFERARSGGILCDLACHQIEQFLTWSGAPEATVTHATTANHAHPDFQEFEDHGELTLRAGNGATAFIRVDWLSPDGLRTWGDGRSFITGTRGCLELRKYVDVGGGPGGNHLYLVDEHGEHHQRAEDPALSEAFLPLVADCLERTETAMMQAHVFRTAELALRAQDAARSATGAG
jgi:predicted dehydrogenase